MSRINSGGWARLESDQMVAICQVISVQKPHFSGLLQQHLQGSSGHHKTS